MDMKDKLAILADAAKYDASCASGGKGKRGAAPADAGAGMGICHSYAPDGRCISLLKILLTNFCVFDCAYCVNRVSSNVPRARFTVAEVVRLTLGFHARNYIEGLFLSSGIIRDADYTMERMVAVARALREEHGFRGYIHLKTIPEASEELIAEAGRLADRLSINVELPTAAALRHLAPEKDESVIRRSMGRMRLRIDAAGEERRPASFAPAGQSTQMIVGADAATDATILGTSAKLYGSYGLRRVYYSAFSPIPDASRTLPSRPAPLLREHRLYQADWLFRFYGFATEEIFAGGGDGMLDLEIDPKLAWALRHRDRFPLDVDRASREDLLRVPGLGARNVDRILAIRRHHGVRVADLARLRVPLKKVLPFLCTSDHTPRAAEIESAQLRRQLAPAPAQLSLFDGHAAH